MEPPTLELVASRGDAGHPAELWLARAATLTDLGELVASAGWQEHVHSRGGFGLLFAWAGDPPDFAEVAALARVLIEQGLFYFGAWGPGSPRVEYAVDVTDVTVQLDSAQPAEAPIVMTSAFGPVPLDDAVFELWELAPRDEGKAPGPARIVAVLGADVGDALASAVHRFGGN